ncbi:Uncharacterised protein [Faecalicoccus pleomorphus]|uniref:Uncharacterized protein n=1 Tax=Faecalicoccus pleomorphus TaxID=1323 RepID=A0A380LLT6_9FIRM|nr:hypothetical protein [Faecalicoccus pleomorphus]SUO03762.1 Uncharacterised protein [Faecalicoccus pleomorphus]
MKRNRLINYLLIILCLIILILSFFNIVLLFFISLAMVLIGISSIIYAVQEMKEKDKPFSTWFLVAIVQLMAAAIVYYKY